MKDRVQRAIKKIEKNGWVKDLRQCPGLKEKHIKLREFLPETQTWGLISFGQLFSYLLQEHCLDFGVCPFYSVDSHRQYCSVISGEINECRCHIPEPFCVLRDKDGEPKYPELMPYIASEMAQFI